VGFKASFKCGEGIVTASERLFQVSTEAHQQVKKRRPKFAFNNGV